MSTTYTFDIKVACLQCPLEIIYQNRIPSGLPLPEYTEAGKRIAAGSDIATWQQQGPVETGSANVTFEAPMIDLEEGFMAGENFDAIINPNTCTEACNDCCDNWGGFTYETPPNIFSPDGDGANDIWYVADPMHPYCAFGIQGFDLDIFTPNGGSPIYSSEISTTGCCFFKAPSPDNPIAHSSIFWDGTNNSGNSVSHGTYFYILEMWGCGQSVSLTGNILLVGYSSAEYDGDEESAEDQDAMIAELAQDEAESIPKERQTKVSIYPNPAEDIIYVELVTGIEGAFPLEIFSADGTLVRQLTVKSGMNVIDIQSFAPGLFLSRLSVEEEGKIFTSKFQKL